MTWPTPSSDGPSPLYSPARYKKKSTGRGKIRAQRQHRADKLSERSCSRLRQKQDELPQRNIAESRPGAPPIPSSLAILATQSRVPAYFRRFIHAGEVERPASDTMLCTCSRVFATQSGFVVSTVAAPAQAAAAMFTRCVLRFSAASRALAASSVRGFPCLARFASAPLFARAAFIPS